MLPVIEFRILFAREALNWFFSLLQLHVCAYIWGYTHIKIGFPQILPFPFLLLYTNQVVKDFPNLSMPEKGFLEALMLPDYVPPLTPILATPLHEVTLILAEAFTNRKQFSILQIFFLATNSFTNFS